MSNEQLLQENRSLGWVAVVDAPAWVKNRILEIRSAVMEKRGVPAPSRAYCAEAEQRTLAAARFVNRLFPNRKNDPLLARATRLGREIALPTFNGNWLTAEERHQLYFAAGLTTSPAEVRAEHRRIFPWES